MSKKLERLLKRAEIKGIAKVNGRKIERDYGHTFVGDLEEQYAFEFHNNFYSLELRHWGTELITLNKNCGVWEPNVNSFYCESKSDRDAIMWLFSQYDISDKISYKPSLEEAHYYRGSELLRKC